MTNGAGTTATGSRNGKFAVEKQPPNMGENGVKISTLRVSQGCRRGVAGVAIFTPNCDQSVQIRQFGTFLPHFCHKISTLRHLCDTCSTPKVSKLKTAYTKGSKRITWLIYLLRHLLDFLARLEKKNNLPSKGVAAEI